MAVFIRVVSSLVGARHGMPILKRDGIHVNPKNVATGEPLLGIRSPSALFDAGRELYQVEWRQVLLWAKYHYASCRQHSLLPRFIKQPRAIIEWYYDLRSWRPKRYRDSAIPGSFPIAIWHIYPSQTVCGMSVDPVS